MSTAIPYLRLAHGAFNSAIAFLFLYQAWLGIRIRRARMTAVPSFDEVRRHRRLGPALALLGISGFFAGGALIYLDKGRILKYEAHFYTGLVIAVLIVSAFATSRGISGRSSSGRTLHFMIGLLLLGCYIVQIALGLGILL